MLLGRKTVDSSGKLDFLQNILDHHINTFCINYLSVTNPQANAYLPTQCIFWLSGNLSYEHTLVFLTYFHL